ncbi:putative spermidine/putrescine transport system permease protein [Pseudochelatococcus lubricantis]|uniref:Spermidine/putrescine transport system permease protein n=1 Tax=Pseudochelatococcus lubricantis TaxID=1538102 RepID=A0ABX0V0N9_9HYPH|nr:ABC transporter permease [Pseudochelatococcus lubricantis]NIJ58766.1 putative spermidine/putrescine transport system permease protein [Pseudochelatococcus lubricantis]
MSIIRLALPNRGRGGSGLALAMPAVLLLLAFFVIPVAMLLLRSITEPEPGLQNYAALVGSPTYAKVFLNTFFVAGIVTLITVLIAFPVAWALTIMPRPWAAVIFAIIILSMWTNLLARTYAWMVLLQQTGLINRILISIGIIDQPLQLTNNLIGVTIGMVYIMLPFMILPLLGVIRKIDPSILQAAALCGATRWQALTRVLLPLATPGIASGGLMVFVMSLGYFVTPSLLGGTANMMLAELIAQQVQSLVNWGMGGAAAFILLVVTLGLYAVQLRFFEAREGTR